MTTGYRRRASEAAEPARPEPGNGCGWNDEGSWRARGGHHRDTTNFVIELARRSREYENYSPADAAQLIESYSMRRAFPFAGQWALLPDANDWFMACCSTSAEETVRRARPPARGSRSARPRPAAFEIVEPVARLFNALAKQHAPDLPYFHPVRLRGYRLAGSLIAIDCPLPDMQAQLSAYLDDALPRATMKTAGENGSPAAAEPSPKTGF